MRLSHRPAPASLASAAPRATARVHRGLHPCLLPAALLGLLLPLTLAHSAGALRLDPRTLPTAVKLWSRKLAPDQTLVRGKIVYVKTGTGITALDLKTGKLLWSRELGEVTCCSDDLVATPDTVAVPHDDKLYLFNAADGTLRAPTELGGSIIALAGPPLVAAVSLDTGAYELVAVDTSTGLIRNRQPLAAGAVYDLAVENGYAVVSGEGSSAGELTLTTGFSADGLKELWRFERQTYPQMQHVEDHLYLREDARDSGPDSRFERLDPATGRLGAPLPPRRAGSGETGWPWELQVVTGPPSGDPPDTEPQESLRRNDLATGKPVWTVELPGHLHELAKDERNIYVECLTGGSRAILARVGWVKGDLQLLGFGLPNAQSLTAAGDLVLAATEDELAAY
ncbi:MAG: PQQ-like beta-propeller repeat protein, partial [Acidobacteriota bacterium]|nr:PQQ-like beta-propeller repeat protein [Acidobacteriota bacterium]